MESQQQHEELLAESGAAGQDGHAETGKMSSEKLGIKGEISHHLWKVHRIPPWQHRIFAMTG